MHIRKNIVILFSFIIFSANCHANSGSLSVAELFCSMPDSILPYMNAAQRKELIDMKEIEPDNDAHINTALGEVYITRLSTDLLTLKLSDNSSLEIGKLDSTNILLIKTYGAPLQESKCTIYNNLWQKKENIVFSTDNLPEFSDTEKKDSLDDIISNAEFIIISVSFTDSPQELKIKFNIPLSYSEDNNKTIYSILQTNVKWANKRFNLCKNEQ